MSRGWRKMIRCQAPEWNKKMVEDIFCGNVSFISLSKTVVNLLLNITIKATDQK